MDFQKIQRFNAQSAVEGLHALIHQFLSKSVRRLGLTGSLFGRATETTWRSLWLGEIWLESMH